MKMLAENAALYPYNEQNVSEGNCPKPWVLLLAAILFCVPACKPTEKKPAPTNGSNNSVAVAKPTVPIRVWFVSDLADGTEASSLIQRQWQSSFDQPMELRLTSAESLLKETKGNCDVLVYPAWMLGELIQRGWLAELPGAMQETSGAIVSGAGASQEANEPQPAGWLDQTRYGRKLWGLSLSFGAPVILANFQAPTPRATKPDDTMSREESIEYWRSLIAALKANPQPNNPQASAAAPAEVSASANNGKTITASSEVMTAGIDALATCDRFLAITTSISSAENRIGMLFNPDDLTPRITDENFVTAGKLMLELRQAGASQEALVGSHLQAWQALTHDKPNITIGMPPTPAPEADKVTSIVVRQPPANPARNGMRINSGWNSGRGLLVSLSNDCRQSGPSVELMRWLASDNARQVFGRRVAGMQSESSYAPGASAWQAQRMVQRLGQQPRLPSEPRLPLALQYRQALGQQIASAIQGEKSVEQALQTAAEQWQKISDSADRKELVRAYTQSLGL